VSAQARTVDQGLDQAIATLGACGYTVNAYRRDPEGNPGIVVGRGDEVRSYTTSFAVLLSETDTDDWLTIVRTLESEATA
jgi:hypothetical protein